MAQNMNLLTRLGCFITGWKPKLLENCTEASFAMLKRYMAGMFILSIIWGVIGWCFADNWMEITSWYGKLMTAAAFVFIIVMVERSILLASPGKAKSVRWIRVGLAVVMAFIGAMIFDQIVFKEDVNREMIERISTKVKEEIPKRTSDLDREIRKISNTIDSINSANQKLNDEYQKKPFITSFDVTNQRRQAGVDENGNPKFETDRITTSRSVPNPVAEQIQTNQDLLKEYLDREKELQNQKLNVWKEVEKEYKEKIGFLEELKALTAVIFDKKEPVAMVFYILLFIFLMCLELLVVTTCWRDDCDYRTLQDVQEKIRKKELAEKLKQSPGDE